MDVTNAKFYSPAKVDQILGTFEGSFSSPAPTAISFETVATKTITTGISEPTFFQGIYSIDNGVTWNDFCNQLIVPPPGILFPYFYVVGDSSANQLVLTAHNIYNSYTGVGNAYTVLYKVALIATSTQGIVTPQAIGSNVFFNSEYNYQKILSETAIPVNITFGQNLDITVPHNLGYIPKIRTFFANNISGTTQDLVAVNTGLDISLDTNNVYIKTISGVLSSIVGTIYVRIYYDD